ncbi:MAG: hypothetical protein R2932_03635 [Caldilineaceae bacterium]
MNKQHVVLLSTYELGRQPFGLASPAAWLRAAGMAVHCQDLALDALEKGPIQSADLVAFYLPMHTATRIATPLIGRVQQINPQAHICCYGLYATLNESYLRKLGLIRFWAGNLKGIGCFGRTLGDNRQSIADFAHNITETAAISDTGPA